MPEAPSIKEAFDEWFASNYGWLGVGDQLLKSDMKQAWDAALATLQPSGERREAIARLATRFWSIHPKEIQDMGLTREQFYVREMTTLLASGLVQDEAGIRDASLLEAMEKECWTLRCVDIPTGGGDADVGWEVIQHHQAKPYERMIAHGGTPTEALNAAIRSARDGGAS